MGKLLEIHPADPQPRLIYEATQILRESGVVVYPTDSIYAIGCCLGDKSALERIRRLRKTTGMTFDEAVEATRGSAT